MKDKEDKEIPPLPEKCTFSNCEVPHNCNETVGSPLCLKMRKEYYGKKVNKD